MLTVTLATVASPIGALTLAAAEDGLCTLTFDATEAAVIGDLRVRLDPEVAVVAAHWADAAVRALDAYFAGELDALAAVAVRAMGSPFQQSVWTALRGIRPGEVLTYGQLAARLGRPGGSRAVGNANGQNPVAIVVPCHRVVAAGGKLGGFAAGLERKVWLLRHERALLA